MGCSKIFFNYVRPDATIVESGLSQTWSCYAYLFHQVLDFPHLPDLLLLPSVVSGLPLNTVSHTHVITHGLSNCTAPTQSLGYLHVMYKLPTKPSVIRLRDITIRTKRNNSTTTANRQKQTTTTAIKRQKRQLNNTLTHTHTNTPTHNNLSLYSHNNCLLTHTDHVSSKDLTKGVPDRRSATSSRLDQRDCRSGPGAGQSGAQYR